jgi:hypothetical protein
MKFFIIGLHGSNKHEIAHELENMGLKYGKTFSSMIDSNIYGDFELYSGKDINEVFENNAYVYMHEVIYKNGVDTYKYFEGLSQYTFDNNDVFVLSPDQLLSIPTSVIPEDVVYIWMDNTKSKRYNTYNSENRTYDFLSREQLEKYDIKEFVKYIYDITNNKMLYFTNEVPQRVSSIIYSIHQHPDLLNIFVENFK